MAELAEAPTLSPADGRDLARLEAAVDTARRSFADAALALREIRDRRLYRTTHATFEDYCRDRWEFTRSQADRLVTAADVIEQVRMTPIGVIHTPATESQCRELAKLPTPEQRARAWETVVSAAGSRQVAVTARLVAQTVALLCPRQPVPAPESDEDTPEGEEDDPTAALRSVRALADALDVALRPYYTRPAMAEAFARYGVPVMTEHGHPFVLAVRDGVRLLAREVSARADE